MLHHSLDLYCCFKTVIRLSRLLSNHCSHHADLRETSSELCGNTKHDANGGSLRSINPKHSQHFKSPATLGSNALSLIADGGRVKSAGSDQAVVSPSRGTCFFYAHEFYICILNAGIRQNYCARTKANIWLRLYLCLLCGRGRSRYRGNGACFERSTLL